MSREVTASPQGHKPVMDRERESHGRREESPVRNHKKSYSRSPSRPRKVAYRDGDRDRERRSDRDRERRYSRSRSRSRAAPGTATPHTSAPPGSAAPTSHSRRYTRSRSHSYGGGERGRSSSHSPMSSRRRHTGTRENPKQSRCVGVFGLSVYTTEEELYHIFSKYGPVERVQVVIDAKSGRSRGFSFVYFESSEDAKAAKDNCSGMRINGKNIRVDFSITERAHTPTPGIYMGRPTYEQYSRDRERGDSHRERDRDRDRDRERRYSRRSPSPYYRERRDERRERRRYERSRSRSYTPRLRKRGYG